MYKTGLVQCCICHAQYRSVNSFHWPIFIKHKFGAKCCGQELGSWWWVEEQTRPFLQGAKGGSGEVNGGEEKPGVQSLPLRPSARSSRAELAMRVRAVEPGAACTAVWAPSVCLGIGPTRAGPVPTQSLLRTCPENVLPGGCCLLLPVSTRPVPHSRGGVMGTTRVIPVMDESGRGERAASAWAETSPQSSCSQASVGEAPSQRLCRERGRLREAKQPGQVTPPLRDPGKGL